MRMKIDVAIEKLGANGFELVGTRDLTERFGFVEYNFENDATGDVRTLLVTDGETTVYDEV